MIRIHIIQDFPQPVEDVFAYLREHENLEPLFGANITRLCNGSGGTRNGAGASRKLRVGPLPVFLWRPTNAEVIPNELIRYRITKGGVFNGREGVMRFSPQGSGSHLDYIITFSGKVPGVGPLVKLMLSGSISNAFRQLAQCGAIAGL